jgi:hypothetical protein
LLKKIFNALAFIEAPNLDKTEKYKNKNEAFNSSALYTDISLYKE